MTHTGLDTRLEKESQTRGEFGAFSLVSLSFIAVMFVSSLGAYASDFKTIDSLGFNAIIDDNLFSSTVELQEKGDISDDWSEDSLHITPLQSLTDSSADGVGFINPSDQSQGFKVNRISASWKNATGELTVGNDWTSFQDLLSVDKGFESANVSDKNRTVVNQIKWLSPNGFSISLEDSPKTSAYLNDSEPPKSDDNDNSPGLILSWQGGPGGTAGAYRVAALGKTFETPASDQNLDGDNILGWGLNLEGGWQMGDLFAALSVTFGKGIDSYVLQRLGNDLVVAPNPLDELGNSLSVQPSLYYRLNNNSNFHVSIGHYDSENSVNNSGIDTLDTINMGYGWTPWPSTKFGVGLVNQDAGNRNGDIEKSTQVIFDAQKRF